MKPRLPFFPTALFLLAGFCLYPLLAFAAENCLMIWPVVLAGVHMFVFVAAFAWCAHCLNRYFDALALWQFHTRRINPSEIHIHH